MDSEELVYALDLLYYTADFVAQASPIWLDIILGLGLLGLAFLICIGAYATFSLMRFGGSPNNEIILVYVKACMKELDLERGHKMLMFKMRLELINQALKKQKRDSS